jgi:DNA-directed RNA polymerase subunit E'
MFYKTKVQDHIRVSPSLLGDDIKAALVEEIKRKYSGYISKELGIVIDVADIDQVDDGIIIPGDGASYYKTTFSLLTYNPKLQEVVWGKIRDIADFGAFINIGPIDGMIHVSQTMNDFVSFSKDKALMGKDTKRSLKVGDKCKAKIIAISFKDINNPKFGLTMRQPYLGKEEWSDEPVKEKEKPAKEKKEK